MQYLVFGILAGATYAIVAIGFLMVYSTLRVYPFQHGAVVIMCSYAFLWTYQQTGSWLIAFLATVGAGLALYHLLLEVVFWPLRDHHFSALMASIGVQIAVVALIASKFYHGRPVAYPSELKLDGHVELLGASIRYNQLLVLCFAVVVALAFDALLRKSRPGMEMRAVSDDRDGAAISGLSSRTSARYAVTAAGITAAVAGLLIGLQQSTISASLAEPLTIKGLAAVLLAGAVSLRGAVYASLFIGLAEAIAVGYLNPALGDAIAYVAIIVALMIKPNGLFSGSTVVVDRSTARA